MGLLEGLELEVWVGGGAYRQGRVSEAQDAQTIPAVNELARD